MLQDFTLHEILIFRKPKGKINQTLPIQWSGYVLFNQSLIGRKIGVHHVNMIKLDFQLYGTIYQLLS